MESASTFTTEDAEVIVLVKVENLADKQKLKWEWYTPEGNLYYSSVTFPIKASRGMY